MQPSQLSEYPLEFQGAGLPSLPEDCRACHGADGLFATGHIWSPGWSLDNIRLKADKDASISTGWLYNEKWSKTKTNLKNHYFLFKYTVQSCS